MSYPKMNEQILPNHIYQGDCLLIMPSIPDKSIDMILCDLPYGTTACFWDTVIPFEPLWVQYKRIIKDNGAIVLTASQPFTSALVMSNIKMFKYEWVWEKTHHQGFVNAKKLPMKAHENILVFYKNPPTYNPIMRLGEPYTKKHGNNGSKENYGGKEKRAGTTTVNNGNRFPKDVLLFGNGNYGSQHPTQKPVALFEYLIKTYTNEGDLVLDNCAGSGTTGVACKNLNRRYILIEKEEKYCRIAEKRIAETVVNNTLGGI
jgi:site-specific DNA-methyltransferase (adenine-specific)